MIQQFMNNRTVNTVLVSGSLADLTTLSALLEGISLPYTKQSEGGTPFSAPVLNACRISVGKVNIDRSRVSSAVSIPHLKTTKSFNDVKTAVVGVWDASLTTAQKCEYCNGIGNSSRG